MHRGPHALRIVGLALAYFGAAKLGLLTAFVNGNVTPVWPPAGIALAGLILLGLDAWPGVTLGATLATFSTGAPLLAALGTGLGNTLEPVVGAYLLKRLVDFRPSLERTRDVFGLIGLAAALSTTLSATVGVASLAAFGVLPWSIYGVVWQTWWLGDAMGVIVFTPLVLTWANDRRLSREPQRIAEAAALFAGLLFVSELVFGRLFTVAITRAPLAYIVFPFMIWAGLRFGPRGAVSAAAVTLGFAIWGTARGRGPFQSGTLNESLLLLHTFMGIVAGTAMVLTAISAEREHARQDLQALNVELDNKVATRTSELARAKDEVERLMELRSKEVSAAVHDLGHGLQSFQATLDVLLVELEQAGTEESAITAAHGRLQAAIDAQHMLLQDMRDAALLESGKLVLRPEATDLAALVRATAAQLEARCRLEACALSVACEAALPPAWCDPARISRVVFNVLENAISYTTAFRDEGAAIEVALLRKDSRLVCRVSDNGPGIAPEELQRLGERFVRGANAHRVPGGTGQGLSFAIGIMQLSDGEITIESAGEGEGTTVTLSLPHAHRRAEQTT
jgi:integral membrane sensor domain MASE1/anti-sigma regulatory factor (Ser/Thr protein kinase)